MLVRILAVIAVLALALGPLNAAAATSACAHMSGTTAEQPVAAASAHEMPAHMPCCDPDPDKSADLGCLAACVAMAGVVADLPIGVLVAAPAAVRTRPAAVTTHALRDHPAPRLERPPRPAA